jgi:hypothetical protein
MAGTFSPSGASACTLCTAGYFSGADSATVCQQCAAGGYSLSGATACIPCGLGKFSAAAGAKDASTCVVCDPGHYASTTGAVSCTPCALGTASSGYGSTTACSGCATNFFASSTGLAACVPCAKPQCAVGFGASVWKPSVDTVCTPCTAIARCTYITAGKCEMGDSFPACVCDPGYEMVSKVCQLCAAGKFKELADYSTCVPWTVTVCPQQGAYFVQGSPYNNSECLACPELPSNAVQTTGGCSWACEAGFDNNQPV